MEDGEAWRGIALDEQHGFRLVGCEEERLQRSTSRKWQAAASGKGVDIVVYGAALAHLYVPGGDSATLTIMGVDSSIERIGESMPLFGAAKVAGLRWLEPRGCNERMPADRWNGLGRERKARLPVGTVPAVTQVSSRGRARSDLGRVLSRNARCQTNR